MIERVSLRRVLAAFARRLRLKGAVEGMALGLLVGLAALGVAWLADHAVVRTIELPLALVGAVAGIGLGVSYRRRSLVGLAKAIERRRPELRNLLVTGAELEEESLPSSAEIRALVVNRATDAARALRPPQLWPMGKPLLSLLLMIVAWIATAASSRSVDSTVRLRHLDSLATPEISRARVQIVPPPYAHLATSTIDDPSRIDALAGSELRLQIDALATSLGIETTELSDSLTNGEGAFRTTLTASADGFVALEPRINGRRGERRLIGLTVRPDRPPRVRITAPAKDLFLSDTHRSIDVAFDADDDLALTSLALRYTKVSGSGERFTFIEDTIPVSLTRTDARHWTGHAVLQLTPLKLEAGDMVVYRAVARDNRPSAPAAESDAWIIDVTAPGMIAAEGFSMDDTENKYALSQQMVILKTERLIAAAKTLSADSVSASAALIAAEQRAVRAEFVFMMGGEVADEVVAAAGLTDLNEEAEAAAEADIAAGRLQNHGRVALVQSIRFMSRASGSLITADLPKALTQEKAALAYLEQAFSRTRYLLRALTQRERLDLARRLTGSLATASSESRSALALPADSKATTLRRIVAAVAAQDERGLIRSRRLSELAQELLTLAPADRAYQEAGGLLGRAAGAVRIANSDRIRTLTDSSVSAIAGLLRAGRVAQPTLGSSALSLLSGALASGGRR